MDNVSSFVKKQKLVAYWLLLGAFCIVVQVLLGGITRITESGLSITEWQPISGTLPPLNIADWNLLFEKYQQTDQYQHLKSGIDLHEFQFLFFWEWLHRNWARFIGVLFALPFAFFIYKKYITPQQTKQYFYLFGLGALQGLMGWLMVRSGLQKGNLFVDHTFLTLHFLLALSSLICCVYFALQILVSEQAIVRHAQLSSLTKGLFVLLCIQLVYGAFMAGLHAATAAATWPKINGDWIPNLFQQTPFIANFLYNKITIHFIHRNLAYAIFIFALIWWVKSKNVNFLFHQFLRRALLILLSIQIALGIFTVVVSPDYLLMRLPAVLHQFVGMLLFVLLFIVLFVVRKTQASQGR